MSPIAIDFETFYSKKLKYGLRTMIAEEYVKNDLFDPYLISVADGSTSWAGSPGNFNWAALDGKVLLAHNKYFDLTVWQEMHRRGWAPKPNYREFHCTANMTAFLCNRRALDNAMEHLFGERISKQVRSNADGKRWPQDYSEGERADMIAYGAGDSVNCWRLWDSFSPQWPELERRLSNITIAQGMRGVQIDTTLLDQYLLWTHEARSATEALMPWLDASEEDSWDDFTVSPTSAKCIAEQCRRKGISAPPVKSHDEEGYEEWAEQHAPSHPWIRGVSAWRSLNKLYKSFQMVKRRLRADGTLPFGLKYFGAHTGRWAGDAGINFQNMRSKPALIDQSSLLELKERRITDALAEKYETGKFPDWVKYSIDFRALVIPRPGKKMISSDLSQIEPRVLAYLTGNWALLDYIKSGMSIYEGFARASMGYAGAKMKKSDDLYKLAKIQVLGLGYQCGWEKFIDVAYDQARIDLTAKDPEFIESENPLTGAITQVSGRGATSKKIVASFRAQNPKTVALWQRMDGAFKSSVGSNFTVALPSGRRLRYEAVRAAWKIGLNKVTQKPEKQCVYMASVDGRRKGYYGGKLTENLVQAVARDVFATHVVAMEDRGWQNLFSVHDEAVLEVDQSVAASDVEAEMGKCPAWLNGCPIAAEAHELTHYTK